MSLSLVDLDSGAIRRVGTFPDVFHSIAFSADGARVAVGLSSHNGIRVYDWSSGKELLADRDYADDRLRPGLRAGRRPDREQL